MLASDCSCLQIEFVSHIHAHTSFRETSWSICITQYQHSLTSIHYTWILAVCSRQHRLRYSTLNFSRIDMEQLLFTRKKLEPALTSAPKVKDIQRYSKTLPSASSSHKPLKSEGPPQAPLALVHPWEAKTTESERGKNAESTRSPTKGFDRNFHQRSLTSNIVWH